MKRKTTDQDGSSSAKRPKVTRDRRFAISKKGKTWQIYDMLADKTVTTFTPFPSTWKKIQATELYQAIMPTRHIEGMMWRQTAEETKNLPSIAGMLNLAGGAMNNMIAAVSHGGDTKEEKTFHRGVMSLFEATNASWGKYGFEATNRLQDIANWMLWKGKVPKALLGDVSGCQDVTFTGSIEALHQEPTVRAVAGRELVAYPPESANRLRSQLAEQALLLGDQSKALHWLSRRDQTVSDEERATFESLNALATQL
jgi:hypothetical protein